MQRRQIEPKIGIQECKTRLRETKTQAGRQTGTEKKKHE